MIGSLPCSTYVAPTFLVKSNTQSVGKQWKGRILLPYFKRALTPLILAYFERRLLLFAYSLFFVGKKYGQIMVVFTGLRVTTSGILQILKYRIFFLGISRKEKNILLFLCLSIIVETKKIPKRNMINLRSGHVQ